MFDFLVSADLLVDDFAAVIRELRGV